MASKFPYWLDKLLGKIISRNGAELPTRPTLNFLGAGVTAADDPANEQTNVTIAGGGGGAGQAVKLVGALTSTDDDEVELLVTPGDGYYTPDDGTGQLIRVYVSAQSRFSDGWQLSAEMALAVQRVSGTTQLISQNAFTYPDVFTGGGVYWVELDDNNIGDAPATPGNIKLKVDVGSPDRLRFRFSQAGSTLGDGRSKWSVSVSLLVFPVLAPT